MPAERPTVAIVGAGIAGLAAGAALTRAGLPVTVLEGRSRLGGRIDTVHGFTGRIVERGAEFVHGREPRMMRLVETAGVTLDERSFEPLILQQGRDVTPEQSWDRIFAELGNPSARDEPIALRIHALESSGQWTGAEAARMRAFVEGYMAADADRASAKALSEETRAAAEIEDEHNARIREGYDALVAALAREIRDRGGEILTGRCVERVMWGRSSVRLDVRAGAVPAHLEAGRCIVTVPLGILQLDETEVGAIAFEPPLDAKVEAARRLAMGPVIKLFLRFRCALSGLEGVAPELRARLDRTSFLRTPGESIPTWWILGDASSPMLVGWLGGPGADALSGRTEDALVEAAVRSLAHALTVPAGAVREALVAAIAADWKQDPWTRGAYSWIPAGATDAPLVLAAPLEDTLYFAGEATDTAGYRGTVHGALVSGLRAAEEILATLR